MNLTNWLKKNICVSNKVEKQMWQTTNVTCLYIVQTLHTLQTTIWKLLTASNPIGWVTSLSTYTLTFTAAFIYFKHILKVICNLPIWPFVTVGIVMVVMYSLLLLIVILNFKLQL